MTELAPVAQRTIMHTSDILMRVARLLVDYPDVLEIDMTLDRRGPTLTLIAQDVDVGKLIGRDARMARALRTLVDAITMRTTIRITLRIQRTLK